MGFSPQHERGKMSTMIKLAGNVGRTARIWTDGDRRDGVIEVVELVEKFTGTLTHDNAGWMWHDADYDRVVTSIRAGMECDWFFESTLVEEAGAHE